MRRNRNDLGGVGAVSMDMRKGGADDFAMTVLLFPLEQTLKDCKIWLVTSNIIFNTSCYSPLSRTKNTTEQTADVLRYSPKRHQEKPG